MRFLKAGTTSMSGVAASVAVLLLQHIPHVTSFYVPGVHPRTFQKNDEVPLKVNAMTSIHTQLPRDYYRLPFCKPDSGPKMVSENLGEFLTGNKIQSSPYHINMLRDTYCQILCQVKLDGDMAKQLRLHIKYGYHNNWIVDNMPSATQGLSKATGEKQLHYAGGFPVGSVKIFDQATDAHQQQPQQPYDSKSANKLLARKRFQNYDAYVYNHVNIILDYHQPDDNVEGYRVVGFAVEPLSIKHRYLNDFEWDGSSNEGYTKPLATCDSSQQGNHFTRGEIKENQIVGDGQTILYTYDVIWQESPVRWASRWDVYLTEDHLVPAQVHWYSITNSILVVVFLSLLVVSILIRSLRRDIAGYNAAAAQVLADEERDEQLEESGWKLIHADVFRPPQNYPMTFCVFVGSGLQLCIAAFAAISFSAVGFLNPARRGSLMTSILVFYMLCGVFAGYLSSRFYKCFRGRQWQLCTLFTAIMFPGLCFGMFLFFNILLAFNHSSGSVPFLDVLLLVFMWCGVSIPLVFLGAFFGYKQQTFTFPTVTSTISRQIPDASLLVNPKVAMFGVGMIPFAAAYVELFFIMSSLWMDQFYYVFGFTFIVFIVLLITTSEVTVLMCYYQFCAENHRWWWFSFITAGSVGFYTFLYAIVFFGQLNASNLIITHMVYFGYMFLLSFATFLVTGMSGFMTCFFFTRKIFSSIKVD